MGATLLDSTVLIDLLRDRPVTSARIRQLLQAGEELCTSGVNVEEIVRGVRGKREQAGVDLLFDGLIVVPIGAVEATAAGTWRRDHAKRGVTLSQADCLIAAACRTVDARLATGNPKDFPMRGVAVDHWPVGQ